MTAHVGFRHWTIQVFYQAHSDDGKPFRATSVFQCAASSVGAAYAIAEKTLGPERKLGAILPGRHLRFP